MRKAIAAMCIALPIIGCCGRNHKSDGSTNQSGFEERLLQPKDLVYMGAFRVPKGKFGNTSRSNSLSFGGSAITFKAPTAAAPKGSLYITGADGFVTEIGIPEIVDVRTCTAASALDCLQTAFVIQPSFDITSGNMQRTGSGGAFYPGEGQKDAATPVQLIPETRPSGFLVFEDTLIGSVVTPYDPNIQLSHYKTNLTWHTVEPMSVNFRGFFRVGEHPTNKRSSNVGMVGGYMTHIPAKWQNKLGGDALTGWVVESVISRSSFGPTASVFRPSDLGKTDPTPAKLLLGYPAGHNRVLGAYGDDGPNHIFNKSSRVKGMVFPEDSGSLIFFGSTGVGVTGEGDTCYGQGTSDLSEVATKADVAAWIRASGANYACGSTQIKLTSSGMAENPCCFDPARTTVKGPHGYPYVYRAWFYKASDLQAVKDDRQMPWEVIPYAVWDLNTYSINPYAGYTRNTGPGDLPFAIEDAHILGAAYDRATNRVYISQMGGDKPGLEPFPLIHVYEIKPQATTDSTSPIAVITSPARNATVSGRVTVAALSNDNLQVSEVHLYADGIYHAKAALGHALTLNTTPLTNGSHILVVKAYDSAGNVGQSPPISITVKN